MTEVSPSLCRAMIFLSHRSSTLLDLKKQTETTTSQSALKILCKLGTEYQSALQLIHSLLTPHTQVTLSEATKIHENSRTQECYALEEQHLHS